MAGNTLVVEGFGWRHAGRKDPALVDINLRVSQGQKVLLLGSSGAGKSTLLAAIAGVADEDGQHTGQIHVGEVDPRHKRGLVGMVLQDPDSQVIASRVGDDIVFGCENLCLSRQQMWQRATVAADMVGLDLPMDHPTSQLSGGQKQRLALAGVLAMQPSVIVLDEPTANIDPEGAELVRDAVIRAADATGATLIVVEHRVDLWADHMDRVVVLGAKDSPGATVLVDGQVQEVLAQQAEYLAQVGIWVPSIPLDLVALSPSSGTGTYGVDASGVGVSGANVSGTNMAGVGVFGANVSGTNMAGTGESGANADALLWGTDLGVGWKQQLHSNLNPRLQEGSTVLMGPNGAGKSTLALTMGGLLPPISGRVHMRGYKGQPHTWRSAQLVQRIGHVFQDPEHQFMARSVREELELGPRLAGMDIGVAQRRVDELLDSLRLRRLERANPFTLSGGEKRRLSVATMLATHPTVLILDEPTFGQDRSTFSSLVRLLQGVVEQGTNLLSISHSPEYMKLMGQHIWQLPPNDGSQSGSCQQLGSGEQRNNAT